MKNDQMGDNPENLQGLFSEVRKADFSAPPFLKTRVMAQLRESRSMKRSLFFYKALSSVALAALVAVSVISLRPGSPVSENVMNQVYVIHVDFNQDDQARVAKAEVELPEGVQFESKRPEVRELRRMKLPVSVSAVGRGKLPFVLSSKDAGEKFIRVKLLDHEDRVVREQTMKFRFAQASEGQTL